MASQRQSRWKRQFFFTVSHFQADLTVQAFSTVVSALVAIFKTAKITPVKCQISKNALLPPTQNCSLSSFFSSKPSAKWLMLASSYGQKMSYIVFVRVQVYLWLPKKCCCLQVSLTLRICVHCKTPFYIAPPLPVMPTLMATTCLNFWTSWLSICLTILTKFLLLLIL